MSGLIVTNLGGDGVRIEAKPQRVELGLSWDSDERMVVTVDPHVLIEIATEAAEWTNTVYVAKSPDTWKEVVA